MCVCVGDFYALTFLTQVEDTHREYLYCTSTVCTPIYSIQHLLRLDIFNSSRRPTSTILVPNVPPIYSIQHDHLFIFLTTVSLSLTVLSTGRYVPVRTRTVQYRPSFSVPYVPSFHFP